VAPANTNTKVWLGPVGGELTPSHSQQSRQSAHNVVMLPRAARTAEQHTNKMRVNPIWTPGTAFG